MTGDEAQVIISGKDYIALKNIEAEWIRAMKKAKIFYIGTDGAIILLTESEAIEKMQERILDVEQQFHRMSGGEAIR